MGILVAGLIGQVRNKVGNMVFSNWKGINTARAYAVPANPQSVEQTAQRTKFGVVVALAQNLLGTLITTFVNPFAVKMSGFNLFISNFIENASSTGLATALCRVVAGTLESSPTLNCTYSTSTGDLSVTWEGTHSGNGLDTDSVNVLVLNNTNNAVVYYRAGESDRVSSNSEPNIGSGLTATQLVVYVWFSRGTGSSFIVSNSIGDVCSAI